MGYRSEVRCLIYGDPDKLQALIIKHTLLGNDVLKMFEGSWRRYKSKRTLWADNRPKDQIIEVFDLSGDQWKWYPDFEDVQSWTVMMRDAETFELEYEFIRIGEEDGDIERESSGGVEGWLGVNSSISCYLE